MKDHDTDRLVAVVLDYIETYGLTQLAREYFLTSYAGSSVECDADPFGVLHPHTYSSIGATAAKGDEEP